MFHRNKKKIESDLPEQVENVFHARKQIHTADIFEQIRKKLVRRGILLAIAVILLVWFVKPSSKVRSVAVTGNQHLSSEYITEVSGIRTSSRFFLCLPVLINLRLQQDPMIESASVSLEEGSIVKITVAEKKAVGYRGDDDFTILFSDNTTAVMKSEYMNIMTDIPYITGFEEEEEQRKLAAALGRLDADVIADISEIEQYERPYDTETLKILMSSGGYVIASYDTVYMLENYRKVYAQQSDHSYCLYAQYKDESKSVMVSQPCPWDTSTAGKEYWTDANGNVITNKYGDQVVKQYYKDADGNDAVDDDGNKIPIPLDSDGMEDIDEDFQDHYENGYYSTGVLVLPESEESSAE